MPDLTPVSFLFILQQDRFPGLWTDELPKGIPWGKKKKADREKAMVDLKNAVAQKNRSIPRWNREYNAAQPHKKLTHLSLTFVMKCMEPGHASLNWLAAQSLRLTWVFLCDVTLPGGRRLSFLGHPHTASEDFGDAPSFSESFYWCGNHPVKATWCKFMPHDFRSRVRTESLTKVVHIFT